jgi:putative membrane-bound dehydrogenase-like protein
VLVCNAPEIVYFKDTNGDGKADQRHVLHKGFGIRNIQQLVNSLQFHYDNRIHGCNAAPDSLVSSVQTLSGRDIKEDRLPIPVRSRHISFNPDSPASLQPTSGGGQYGLSSDDWGHWFTCTNSQHLRQIVLPDHYLARNPHTPVPAVTLDIPDRVAEHNAAGKIFRISPFDPWRLERTAMRKDGPMSSRFVSTELVPGGFFTSACGLTVYRGHAFPPAYYGNVFVCDPANNLIHRDILVSQGVTFSAKRADEGCEFLASTDRWFRPTWVTYGPDGALYVADFYREIIETPLSLPEDIKNRYNLQSRQRGRIWRIVPDGWTRPKSEALSEADDATLVKRLAHANAWQRLTAQRLLFERHGKRPTDSLVAQLKAMVERHAPGHGSPRCGAARRAGGSRRTGAARAGSDASGTVLGCLAGIVQVGGGTCGRRVRRGSVPGGVVVGCGTGSRTGSSRPGQARHP